MLINTYSWLSFDSLLTCSYVGFGYIPPFCLCPAYVWWKLEPRIQLFEVQHADTMGAGPAARLHA
jgi:hypothetical protein